jgi:hypothetical protein
MQTRYGRDIPRTNQPLAETAYFDNVTPCCVRHLKHFCHFHALGKQGLYCDLNIRNEK